MLENCNLCAFQCHVNRNETLRKMSVWCSSEACFGFSSSLGGALH